MQQVNFEEGLEILTRKASEMTRPRGAILIGVAGGSASGKSHLTRQVTARVPEMTMLSLDHYYKGKFDMPDPDNYDHPDCLELELLASHLGQLRRGVSVDRPKYDFATSSRVGFERMSPSPVICVEGLYALHPIVKNLLDFRVFVEASERRRLERRIARDIAEGRRPIGSEGKIDRYWDGTVEPMYLEHIAPTKAHADLIIVNDY